MTHMTRTCPECAGVDAPMRMIEHKKDCSILMADNAVLAEDRARLHGMDLSDDGGIAYVRPMAEAERARQALEGYSAPATARTYVYRLSQAPDMVGRTWPDQMRDEVD